MLPRTAGVDVNTNMISLHVVGWTCIVCAGVCTDIEFIVGSYAMAMTQVIVIQNSNLWCDKQ